MQILPVRSEGQPAVIGEASPYPVHGTGALVTGGNNVPTATMRWLQ